MPVRIQLSRAKGWRMPPNTVKVDRSTTWGNPFCVGRPVDRKMARRWGWWPLAFPERQASDGAHACRLFAAVLGLDEAIHEHVKDSLRGKNLACWCEPGAPCHADVLLELANRSGDGETP